jgi:electron transport complex protein RnfB
VNATDQSARPVRRKKPKYVAVIDRDCCTGCEACVEICPVACIDRRRTGAGVMGIDTWCEIDQGRCIGCRLCIRLPAGQIENFSLEICPWDAIQMVSVSDVQP